MRKEVYYCDYCQKELGRKTHISVEFGRNSGWVKPVSEFMWQFIKKASGIHQFCNGQCLLRFFKALKVIQKK